MKSGRQLQYCHERYNMMKCFNLFLQHSVSELSSPEFKFCKNEKHKNECNHDLLKVKTVICHYMLFMHHFISFLNTSKIVISLSPFIS